jgi:hypothetical protein
MSVKNPIDGKPHGGQGGIVQSPLWEGGRMARRKQYLISVSIRDVQLLGDPKQRVATWL